MGIFDRFRKRPQRPNPDWVSYRCNLEKGPGLISMDAGWIRDTGFDGATSLVLFDAPYTTPQTDRLVNAEELPLLQALTAAVERVVDTDMPAGTAFLIGYVYEPGRMAVAVYTSAPDMVRAACMKALAQIGTHEVTATVEPDPDWKYYTGYLYPHPEDWQRIGNQRVCANLASNGDDGTRPRKIDHGVYFPSQRQAEAFGPVIEAKGYTVARIEKLEETTPGREYLVEFEHVFIPRELDPVTIELRQLAEDHGGDYDGWACFVLRDTGAAD